MGVCHSKTSSDVATAKRIDDNLHNERALQRKEVKLLLLGTGESGKSTVFKQMQIIHNNGFDRMARLNLVPVIRKHAIEVFADLFKAALVLGLVSSEQEHEVTSLLLKIDTEGVSDDTVDKMTAAWESTPMQEALCTKENRAKVQIPDSTAHFLSCLPRVFSSSYEPTDADILACRVRTTGVSEMQFNVQDAKFRIVDVGGQRNERRKWIHCFEDVQAVIFVTAISEYDQSLFEDEKTNRLQESLRLFGEISNTRFFADAAIILFLNKKDLFEEKIGSVDLSVCFPDYTEGCSYDHGVDFIKRKFQAKTSHDIFTHVTCATSTGNVRFVFDSVKEQMLMQNASAAGLL